MRLWLLAAAASAAPLLEAFDGYDATGEAVVMRAVSPTVQRAFISPAAAKFTLNLRCAKGQQLYVDGAKHAAGAVTLKKDQGRHVQVVEVVCEDRKAPTAEPDRQKYLFLVTADHPAEALAPPLLLLNEIGMDCESDGKQIVCPDPKIADKMASVTPRGLLTDVQYTLHTRNRQTEHRLLNDKKTIPFAYNSQYYITAESGRNSQTWPVSFGGTPIGSVLHLLGSVLALALLALLAVLSLVVGSSSLCGQGHPLGATETASMFALVIQYFTFSNKLRGSNFSEAVATPVKWVSLFWPAPSIYRKEGDYSQAGLSANQPAFSRAYGIRLWGDSILGDVNDIRNAWGCMIWCIVGIALLCAVHAVIIAQFTSRKNEIYTFPHRLRFGNWENRVINLLVFPLAMACGLALFHPSATRCMAILGGVLLFGLMLWIVSAIASVSTSISSGDVVWVWESSVRESGSHPATEAQGYWCDAECDQLLTQPVNRGICGQCFDYRWVTTVADIRPTMISTSNAHHDGDDTVNPVSKLKKAHTPGGYPLAKNPQVVEVEQARKPCCGFRGEHLPVGALRTKWLDVLFSYEGLTKFMEDDQAETPVPLLVKTHQLAGPITSGANAFFFDGARVPFIRIAESIWKVTMGLLLAFAASTESNKYANLCYLAVAVLGLSMMGYVLAVKPYSRRLDNCVVAGVAAIIGTSAGAFCLYNYNQKTCLADGFSLLITACAFALSLYAVWMIASVISAVTCPPLDEAKFLEKLANCSVIVDEDYQMAGYSKYAARDIVAKSKSGRAQIRHFGTFEDLDLNFDHADIARACQTGILPIP